MFISDVVSSIYSNLPSEKSFPYVAVRFLKIYFYFVRNLTGCVSMNYLLRHLFQVANIYFFFFGKYIKFNVTINKMG